MVYLKRDKYFWGVIQRKGIRQVNILMVPVLCTGIRRYHYTAHEYMNLHFWVNPNDDFVGGLGE